MHLADLATPCVLVERPRLFANLEAMQAKAEAQGVALRPHTKTHKSLDIARRQVRGGAQGITVAKVGEAEAFVPWEFDDIRLAYTVVGDEKFRRLQALRDQAQLSFCVDTRAGAQAASDFFAETDTPMAVLVEVDCGYGRCGVRWDADESLDFVRFVRGLPGLRLVGILTHAGQSYDGPAAGETKEAALRRYSADERDRMLAFAARLGTAGLATPGDFEISIGSTPSMRYFENREQDGFRITEIRPGNYVFHDMIQVALGAATMPACALTVLATVISKHRDASGQERLFLDAGKKVLTSDTGYATDGYGTLLYNARAMRPLPHARLVGLSEEHGWVTVPGGATMEVGDRVRIVPNHACVVVNTQPHLYLVEGQEVIGMFDVTARGLVR